jgi:hypothetical protein
MTYDPLKIIAQPKMGIFSGLPSAAPGTVLVVDREGHPVQVLAGHGDRLTAGEVRWGRIRTLYEVDVTEHRLEFQDAFPCKDDIGGFRATVKLACVVADPSAVVIRGIRDAARVLVPPVTETLRRVCRGFAAEDYQEAEKAGLAAIRSLETGTGHDSAFHITQFHFVLVLDDAAAMYVRERKEATRDRVRQEDAALLEREKARLESEFDRARDQLEADRARAAAEFEQERLVMQQSRDWLEGQLEDQRQQLELARAAARARAEQEGAGEIARARDQLEADRARAAAEFEQERLVMQQSRDRLEGQLEDQRQQLELARAAARARAEQEGAGEIELARLEFEVVRQRKQAELDAQKLELDLERARLQAQYDKRMLEAKLERDRLQVTELTRLLGQGQFAALAMQLAQDPAAIGPIIDHLADQRAADINRQLQALRLLVENDGLEGWQITEQAKTILHRLIATWTEHSGQALPPGGSMAEIPAPTPQETTGPMDSVIEPGPPLLADDGEFPRDRDASGVPRPVPGHAGETRD